MKPGRDRGLADVELDCCFAVGVTDQVDGRDGVPEVGRQGGDRRIHVAGMDLSLWLGDDRIDRLYRAARSMCDSSQDAEELAARDVRTGAETRQSLRVDGPADADRVQHISAISLQRARS